MFGALLLPIAICWTLYFYYFFAQDLENPQPVAGRFVDAVCWSTASSGKSSTSHMQRSITSLQTQYEFDSRSKSFAQKSGPGTHRDTISEHVEQKTWDDCELAAQQARSERAPKTIWAGEDDIDARFRARLTEVREYPAVGLLWVPALIAGIGIALWTRAARR